MNTIDRATDSAYLDFQYADSEKLRIRQETHRLYSENKGDFLTWIVDHLAPRPGDVVADVACGPGAYHPLLAKRRVRVIGLDASHGMVVEARQQARAEKLPAVLIQARAEYLPLADAVCDRLMANHMLYHVPDQEAALREMRRVLKVGGRVVLATNAADNSRRLFDLHAAACEELGYLPSDLTLDRRFTLAHLSLVQTVFPNARVEVRQDAFQFPDTGSVLRYYATAGVDHVQHAPADNSHRSQLLSVMERKIGAIVEREGVFRVQKNAGCFVAEKK